ncbi:MAG: hypothetical protein WCJ37_03445 [Syntrophus sp. (in: bacteria)]
MTAQIHDRIRFNKESYGILSVAGGPLVTPEQFGTSSEIADSSCWRRYYVVYELTDSGFYLRELTMLRRDGDYVPIDGVLPESDKESDYPTYHNLNVPVPFSGRIRIARGFIEDLYVHGGFQSPTAFRTVYDLTLENGRMVKMKDRSKVMAIGRIWDSLCRPFRFS